MSREIERKFLVCGEFRSRAKSASHIVQGYIAAAPGRTVRVRICDGKGYLTIKGETDSTGTGRYEWEKEISLKDAEELLGLCEPGRIEKTRYRIPVGRHVIEVDVFHGSNEGLVMAEVELTSSDDEFDKPSWLGKEVTGDPRYYNSYLSVKPFKTW